MLSRRFRRWRPLQAGMLGMVYAVTTPILVPTLKSSEPSANAELDESPGKIALTFAAFPSAEKSTIELFSGQIKLETGSVTSESNGVLSADIRSDLKPGRYIVRWKSVCLCSGQKTAQGRFEFIVK